MHSYGLAEADPVSARIPNRLSFLGFFRGDMRRFLTQCQALAVTRDSPGCRTISISRDGRKAGTFGSACRRRL